MGYTRNKSEGRLRMITLHLLETDLKLIDNWIQQGYIINRAEFIRTALRKEINEMIEGPELIKKYLPKEIS